MKRCHNGSKAEQSHIHIKGMCSLLHSYTIGQTEPQEKQQAPLFLTEAVRKRHTRTYRSSFHAQRTKRPYRKQTTKGTSTYKSRAIRRDSNLLCHSNWMCGLKYIKLPFAEQATDFLKNALPMIWISKNRLASCIL